ncbi:MAG: hypothetical protein PHH31_08660, partial [Acidaminococcaceae bacterium]|nr:hypothetical protein [Acidaminococcaceae bacterium]
MFGYIPSSQPQISRINANVVDMYRLVDIDVNEAVASTVPTHLNIETYPIGICQIETATAAGTVIADPGGDATVIVTAANMPGSPKSVSVPLLLNDGANEIATKIRAALTSDANVGSFFTIGGETDKIILTAKTVAENDTTINIAIEAGTATGVTAAATSTNTKTGSKNEIVHPSILFFPNGWNGYKYWLGYTCFDNGGSTFENPCISVSNDNVTWTTPTGLTNPVEPEPASGFNADVNLFMSPDEKTMYMVFKYHVGGVATTYIRSSTDGVNWTAKEALFTNSFEDLSPAVVWDGLQYKMWTVKNDDTPNNFYLRTATNATGPWSDPILCSYTLPSSREPWHMDVRKVGNQYHMLLHADNNLPYFGKSEDGLSWVFGTEPVFLTEAGINDGYYKHTMYPKLTEEGLVYGLWYGTSIPYYICYSEIKFNRTKEKTYNEHGSYLLQATHNIPPWIFCDTFDRTDTDQGLGTSDSGHAWQFILGSKMGISSNQAYVVNAANAYSI